MSEFRMPSLGADMEYGTVLEWRVREGERVKRGDIVALVDTEKAEIEVEIWQSGVVERLVVPVGERVPVGTLIALLRDGAESAAPGPQLQPEAPPVAQAPAPAPRFAPSPPKPGPGRIAASPLARRRAHELGIDLARVAGSGPRGAVRAADLASPPARSAAPTPADRMESVRRRIALAMERSKREIPHYYLQSELDMSRPLAWLAEENSRRPLAERLIPAALLLRAVARAAAAVPELNGHWIEGAFRPGAGVHVGWVIAMRGGGVLVPTIRDADRKDVSTLMRELQDVTGRARRFSLRSGEVGEATLTVSSLGDLGVATVFGVIYPPQVALVGLGRIAERAWAEGGSLSVRPVLHATLSADHRASDGQRGARFLAALARGLERPEAP